MSTGNDRQSVRGTRSSSPSSSVSLKTALPPSLLRSSATSPAPPSFSRASSSSLSRVETARTSNDAAADLPGNESDSDESLDGLIDRVTGLGIGENGDKDARSVLRSQLRKGKGRLRETSAQQGPSDQPATTVITSTVTFSQRKYYILSTAGKLVYTNDQAEEGSSLAFVGVIQAVISVFLDSGDKLKHIDTGTTKIVFLLKPPLYLVVASDWQEPIAQLRTHLEYLHHLVLALVSQAQLNAVFQRRSNYDLRRLLEGTDGIFASMLDTLSDDLNTSLATISIARCDPLVRENALRALTPKDRPKDLLYMLLLCPKLVTLIRPRSHSIHPSDLHLLLASLPQPKENDADTSFYPFCLPKFNSQGFLYVYTSWKDGIGIVIVRSEREVDQSRRLDQAVRSKLADKKLTRAAISASFAAPSRRSVDASPVSVGDLNLPGLRHFVYKHRLAVQLVEAAYEGDYGALENRRRLVTLYEHAHESLKGARMSYFQTDHESIYAWSTSTFELYVTASPMLPKRAIVALARGVSRWVKEHERELFLLGAPSF